MSLSIERLPREDVKNHLLIQFGLRVKQERLKLGLTQEELGNRASLHRTYIGMVERAEKNITLLNIGKIAVALNMSIAELVESLDLEESDCLNA